MTARLRVLVLAEQCNPEWPSLPIVGYKYALALSSTCDVTVVTQVRNEPMIRARHPEDTHHLRWSFIDTEYIAAPLHRLANVLRRDPEVAWSTNMAMSYPPYVVFERQAWKRFKGALRAAEYDVVHRITPMSPTLPSWMAGRAEQPFVMGPLNGNLAWPAAFAEEQKRERERIRVLRDAYKVLPFTRRSRRRTDLFLAAFQHTVDDLAGIPAERVVMVPEVGYDEEIFFPPADLPTRDGDALTFLFAGRLVPYKLAEVAVRAFASSPALRGGHQLRVIGDGPERPRLEQIVREHGAEGSVVLEGRRNQAEVAEAMRESDVFVFPSIRELGAGVVVEAMACGMLSLVVDYGGPADLVQPGRGHKVAMAPLETLVAQYREEMEKLAASPHSTEQAATRREAVRYASENYPWRRKAEITVDLYERLLAGRTDYPRPY